MIFVEIKNWKEVVNQFGLYSIEGYRGAKDISKHLKAAVTPNNIPPNIAIPYQIEANDKPQIDSGIALFNLLTSEGNKHTYEYTGTAK